MRKGIGASIIQANVKRTQNNKITRWKETNINAKLELMQSWNVLMNKLLYKLSVTCTSIYCYFSA